MTVVQEPKMRSVWRKRVNQKLYTVVSTFEKFKKQRFVLRCSDGRIPDEAVTAIRLREQFDPVNVSHE